MKLLSILLGFALVLALSTQAIAKGEEHGNGALYPPPKANLEDSALPGKVELVEPTFNSSVSGSVTLKWNEVANAQNYHLQVATDPNFKWLKADEHMYTGTSYEVKDLEAGKHYYWRVAATNQGKWVGSTKGYYSKSMFATK
jgi:hypothetical protein